MRFLSALTGASLSAVANTTICVIGGSIALSALGLTALYLLTYVQETPQTIKLQCLLGFERPDCPDNKAELAALKAEIEGMQGKLDGLRRIEEAVDTVTLFKTVDIAGTDLELTVGTKYSKLIDADKTPDYFCYIDLNTDGAYEDRNITIRTTTNEVILPQSVLDEIGMDEAAYLFARSQCKPYLIAGGA